MKFFAHRDCDDRLRLRKVSLMVCDDEGNLLDRRRMFAGLFFDKRLARRKAAMLKFAAKLAAAMCMLLLFCGCGKTQTTSQLDEFAAHDGDVPASARPAFLGARRQLAAAQFNAVAVKAFDAMFHVASMELKDHGHQEDGERLVSEWNGQYRAFILGAITDVGDHKPWSQWVADWYAAIEAVLGEPLMQTTHLRDIWVLNYTIPVVFNRPASNLWCTNQVFMHPDDTCEAEYRRHFAGTRFQPADPYATDILHDGFAGVVTYWAIWAGCEGATWGGGWFVICMPLGDLGEDAMEKWIAPKLSNKLYERVNTP